MLDDLDSMDFTEKERPLVTLALLAYNQENYIQQAIEGAFSQTYEPLEIILSDDCSTDRTFDIMQTLVSLYRGNHKIRLNRNTENLNIGRHINRVNNLARGKLVVAAAGDDISLPQRVDKIVKAWNQSDRMAWLIHSACRQIDENGNLMQDLQCPCLLTLDNIYRLTSSNSFVIGATEAWTTDLFSLFGDFRSDLVHEDRALPFRTLLAGKIVRYIDEPLVLYRQGTGVSSTYKSSATTHLNRSARRLILTRLKVDAQQKLDDLRIKSNEKIERIALRSLHRYEAALSFEDGVPRLQTLAQLTNRVGPAYVLKMILKRLKNKYRDSRHQLQNQ